MKRLLIAAAAIATLAHAAPAQADLLELKWASEGYFRTRTVLLTNLAREPRRITTYPSNGEDLVIPEIRRTSYIVSRLRLHPMVQFENLATLHMQIDALDDVLWGDNNAISSAPLFVTDDSNQGFLGGDGQASIEVKKVWLEFPIPVGVMRVGRMPSHWGMGLLANGGGTFNMDPDPSRPRGVPQRKSLDSFFDDDFGDNHFGSEADRILFITKPITIAKTIAKSKDTSSKLVTGYAFSKLAEAPLLRAEPFERQFRPFGQQGFISRGKNDDVNEHVFFAVWNDPFWDPGGPLARHTDELRAGGYFVLRRGDEGSTNPSALDPNEFCGTFDGSGVPCVDTGSKVWIGDLWYRIRYGPFYSEAEGYYIFGKTFGGVPFPSKNEKKKANITGAVWRAGYLTDLYDGILEIGHASGDDDLTDENFKQRAMHPDFNVGLVLFEEILRERTARIYGPPFFSDENPDGAVGLMSKGGVINANYINPRGRYHLDAFGLTLVGGVLFAWVDELANVDPGVFQRDDTNGKTYLGTEFDAAIKSSFAGGKMDFSLESGWLFYGGALKAVYPNADNSFTLQTRLAFVW